MSAIRQRILTRIYGDGMGAVVAAMVTERMIAGLQRSIRHEPELLDVTNLVPGESYVVTTRPPPDRRERKLQRRAVKLHRRLDAAERPSAATRRAQRRLSRAERRVATATAGSRRARRAAGRASQLAVEVARRRAPSDKQLRLRSQVAVADDRLARRRDARLARARRKARAPRSRIFR